MTDLIQYPNGVFVEVSQPKDRTVAASSAVAAKVTHNIESTIKAVEPLLRPLQETLGKLMSEQQVTSAELKLGLSFTAEGNIFVTKATGEANLEVTLHLDRRGQA